MTRGAGVAARRPPTLLRGPLGALRLCPAVSSASQGARGVGCLVLRSDVHDFMVSP